MSYWEPEHARTRIVPGWNANVPVCSESCPQHDGERCGVLGHCAPTAYPCPIAISRVVMALEGSRLIAERGLPVPGERDA